MDKLINISNLKIGFNVILSIFLLGCSVTGNDPLSASESPSASASAEQNLLDGDLNIESRTYTVTINESINSKDGVVHPVFKINYKVNLHRDNNNYTGYYIDGIDILESTYIDDNCLLYYPETMADTPVYNENHQILIFPVEFGFIPDISSETDLSNCKIYSCNIDGFTKKNYTIVLNLFDLLGEYRQK